MADLSDPDVLAFLAHGTRTGKVGWTAQDGRPLVAPVWFLVEDGTVVFNTGADTAKGRAFAEFHLEYVALLAFGTGFLIVARLLLRKQQR